MDVSRHYNKHRPRNQSSNELVGIRSYHNFVKACLITEAVALCGTTDRYLDMCCGNGGDIGKLVHHGIKQYFGIDIANMAVERAVQRLSEQEFVQGDAVVFNAFSATAGHMLSNMKPFDIVSCQFAIHYAFQDERTARTFIQNVAFALRVGGSFIITVPDADHLAKSFKHLGKKFADEHYQVHFDTMTLKDGDFDDFGTAYEFSFTGAVDKLKEFIVKKEVLVQLCHDCGMRLLETRNFAEYKDREDTLRTRMAAVYHPVSRIYRTYHFIMDVHES